ncbi:type I restriction enzyme S subunit [Sphaerotilus sulfidivorans]|uniref:Restriction endonuclease subunit S n=1 Tax=Sphaerotilus sulfidivorans TaxID=639200 RepID=A0A5C1PW96_9BURK|nr:restriction endonuclease subunit S [Sphaerotilus sulfidivorans]NZD47885.1 restriction endonuclease subunit S [Sphaerotilus sulfidivorans]QEM99450.1 restriction endonuclease subunit S [Sphaerotilus sulfidivorans]
MKDWPVVALRDVAEIAAGITLGRKTNETELVSVPYLRVANVQDGSLNLSEVKTVEATRREIEKWRLRDGDLLLTEGGDLDKLGRGTCWREQLPLCIHQNHIFRVRLPEDRYDPDFVSLQVGSGYGKAYFFAHAKKTTGIASINQQVLGSFPLLSPPLPEQQRIARALRERLAVVAEARRAAQAQTDEMDALRAAIYRESFRGVVPVAVPPEGMAEAPQGWRWAKLGDLARLESGHTPSRSRPDWWGGDISWVSLTEIRALDGTWVESTQIKTNEAGIANSSARILPRGTVCFSRTASVGFVTVMARPMATSQDFANWVCGDELDPEFLMYALICSRRELRALATGATHKTIYMPMLGSFHLCLPDRATQGAIVQALKAQLAAAEEARQAVQAQLDEIKRLPGRLLVQAFDSNHSQ